MWKAAVTRAFLFFAVFLRLYVLAQAQNGDDSIRMLGSGETFSLEKNESTVADTQQVLSAVRAPAPTSTPLSDFSIAQASFAVEMMEKLCGMENCVFSPYSIYNILGMVLLAAGGNTETQLMEAMAIEGVYQNNGQLHELIGGTKTDLLGAASGEDIVINVADNIFTSALFQVSPDYIEELQKYYKVDGPQQVNFADGQSAADEINQYVEDNTQGQIKELFSPQMFNELTLAVLVNAIYLDAKWEQPFDETQTQPSTFLIQEGQSVDVQMMEVQYTFRYDMTEKQHMLELPYKGGEFALYLIVPKSLSMSQVRQSILADEQFIYNMQVQLGGAELVRVQMPKFSFKDKTDLTDVLKLLGITDLFQNGVANLAKAVPENTTSPYISEAVHEAKIEVGELGTVAAAATGAVFGLESGQVGMPLVRIDSPFIYMLVYKPTSSIVFMGQIVDPSFQE